MKKSMHTFVDSLKMVQMIYATWLDILSKKTRYIYELY